MKKLRIALALAGVIGQYSVATDLLNITATDFREVLVTDTDGSELYKGRLDDQEYVDIGRIRKGKTPYTVEITTDNCQGGTCETATLSIEDVKELGIEVESRDVWGIYRRCAPGQPDHNQLNITEFQERKK